MTDHPHLQGAPLRPDFLRLTSALSALPQPPDGTPPEHPLANAQADVTRPTPDRLVDGDPVHSTWNVEDRGGLYCGLWRSTPGAWRISYDEWEYCRILSGRSVITSADGTDHAIGPGDSFILRPGFRGIWRVLETTIKEYVIRI